MTEYTIEVTDGLADVLEEQFPPQIELEDWLALQVEQAISETYLQEKRQSIQQSLQQ